MPPELEAIVARSLERDRDGRYPTALAMAQDLRELLMERRASVGTAGRELMSVLFSKEIVERRTRIQALLASADTVPISSSLPSVVTSVSIPNRDASTVNEFVNALNRRNRLTFGALLTAVVCLLGAVAILLVVVRRSCADRRNDATARSRKARCHRNPLWRRRRRGPVTAPTRGAASCGDDRPRASHPRRAENRPLEGGGPREGRAAPASA